MKCKACGKVFTADDFLKIEGTFVIRTELDYAPDAIDTVNLWACPKCGTVRISHWRIEDD